MATKAHKNSYGVGDIVGYSGSYSTKFYGYKLLKEVWVGAVGDYIWLGQYGTVGTDNTFTPDNGGKNINALTDKDIKEGYTEVWTKDIVPEYAKGDILTGTHEPSGARVVLRYISDTHVERLTPYDGLGDQGWGSLKHFQGRLKDIKVLTSALSATKFSAL